MSFIDTLTKGEVSLPAGKSKQTYMLLAIFLGSLGIHNFWAGNEEKAKVQLIVGLVGGFCCCGIGSLISWITAIMDVSKVKEIPAA